MRPTPRATYRVQLTPTFGFDDVVGLLDHIVRLGVSHVYLSPVAEAVPGSTHGYDVVDHTVVRRELGGAPGFERLLDAAVDRGLQVVIDHVPNHVAATAPHLNPPWWALLREGRDSVAADWFDVDWDAGDGRIILPVLGSALDALIAEELVATDGDHLVAHGERRLPIRPGTGDLPLRELIDAQHYVLTDWRSSARNVRRFFTIDDLVAVRVEHEHVAAVVDTIPVRYAPHPGFAGVRVDHVDGLADPLGYLNGLRERLGDDALIYVEKILAPDESLPAGWPVDGTTGYEFVRLVDHALLAAETRDAFEQRWRENSDSDADAHEYEAEARREVVAGELAPDLARLTRLARSAVDAPASEVADELFELTTTLPRYRTYLPDDPEGAAIVASISDGPVAAALLSPSTPAQVELRTRWQQLTGPVMAKGAEDRSFYRYLRFAALCEVGGTPADFGISVDEFHRANGERAERMPRSLLASSTHDTKRSEDVRWRSIALSWRVAAPAPDDRRWLSLSRAWVREVCGRTGVDAVTVSLAIQTVIATPGLDVERFTAYLVKATREAARHTSWAAPDADYEARLGELAELAVTNAHIEQMPLSTLATGVSLAATTLRLTAPGVPDIYQGTEGFSFRLVDPDNRVPPDWGALRAAATDDRSVAELWAQDDPVIKTVLMRTLLDLRRRHAPAFAAGSGYGPIEVGPGAIAFTRAADGAEPAVVVVVRRGAAEVASTMRFPGGDWYDLLDPGAPTLRGEVATASLVGSGDDGTLPVAVFERD